MWAAIKGLILVLGLVPKAIHRIAIWFTERRWRQRVLREMSQQQQTRAATARMILAKHERDAEREVADVRAAKDKLAELRRRFARQL